MDKVLRNFHKKVKSLVTKSFPLFRKKDKPSWAPKVVQEFITTYDPKKKLFLLWDIPEKFQAFYKLFFEDHQVLFIKTVEEFASLSKSLNLPAGGITLFTLVNKNSRLQAATFCKKYRIKIVYLKPGLIGHPVYRNLPACFLDTLNDGAGNYDEDALIKMLNSAELPPSLLEQAIKLKALYCSLKIGKGSAPSFINVDKFLGIKLKKRALILPQADSLHNKQISENSLIELAIQENPESDIYLYRRDVQPSFKLLHEEIESNNQSYNYIVITKAIRTTDLIIACDHIYTDDALDAVDAIFYHKKLTVTRRPFYSGWGLTDDRLAEPQIRQLTSDEFFALIFLKCTRYCYDNHDPVHGLLSTLFDVAGSYALQRAHSAGEPFSAEKLDLLCKSDYWAKILNVWTANKDLPISSFLDLSTVYPLGKKANHALTAALIGATKNTSNFRCVMDALNLEVPVTDIIAFPSNAELISPEFFEVKLHEARSLIRQYNYGEAEKILYLLLLSGFIRRDILSMLADICASTFHLQDAISLQDMALKLTNPKTENYSVKHNELLYILGDGRQLLSSLCLGIKSAPSQFIHAYTYRALLKEQFGADFQYANSFFNASKCRLKNGKRNEDGLLAIAHGHMLLQEPKKQLKILASIKNPKNIVKYNLTKATAYIQAGEYAKARDIIEPLLVQFTDLRVYKEAARLALLMNDFLWGEKLFQDAQRHNLQTAGELIELSLLRRFLFNTNQLQEGFKKFRNVEICDILKSCLRDKYIQQPSDVVGDKVLVVAISGIGDEIRVATMYPKMAALIPNNQICFTCEPRLSELFTTSYPNLEFVPVSRQRSLSYKTDLSNYNDLPYLQLHKLFDNNGWKLANNFDVVTLTTDLLGELLQDKSSFCSHPYLKASSEKINYWAQRIKSSNIKIGISWRSSLLAHNRSTGYLTIELLKPLLDKFADKDVEFFNLQYDDATEELAWAAKNCQSKITHFTDLDQYNDINSVAALMSCMDLIIAPPTAVIELAGALGRPSFLLSNIGEIGWRKANTTNADIWSRSILHIEGDICGDKTSLVNNLIQSVEAFITERAQKINDAIVIA